MFQANSPPNQFVATSIKLSVPDQGGEGRSEHTKGFCPPLLARVSPSMEPGHRFAPRLRRVDYSTFLGVVSLLVCSPACLPAARKGFCALFRTRPDGLTLLGTGPHVQFPSLL